MQYDFVLLTEKASMELRYQNALEAMKAQGRDMLFIGGQPVPDVD
jgi:hypothetical protein